jgi:heptosyltransferase-3
MAPVRTDQAEAAILAARPLHQRFNRWSRRVCMRLLNRSNPRTAPWPAAGEVRQILVVRANYRLGNIVIATALLPVLQQAYPRAAIDFLVGEGPAKLLAGLPIRHVETITRRWLRTPWKAFTLGRILRRRRYDLVIDGSFNSFSGTFYAWLTGARHRAGAQGRADRLLTIALPVPASLESYGVAPWLAEKLGVTVAPQARLQVSAAARQDLYRWLDSMGGNRLRPPMLAIFVGGHHEKRWPAEHWLTLLDGLANKPWPTLVLVGPEERELVGILTAAAHGGVRVIPPQPLPRFTALLAESALLITTDSGPLHIAAALHVPVLALIQSPHSLRFMPPGTIHRTVMQADPAAVLSALSDHPALPRPERPPAANLVQT